MDPAKSNESTTKVANGVELKNVSGLLALAASVFTTFGFVTRFLSFRWSPVFSIRNLALALATLTSPIDWLVVGVTGTLLTPLPLLGGLVAGIAVAKRTNQKSNACMPGFLSAFAPNTAGSDLVAHTCAVRLWF